MATVVIAAALWVAFPTTYPGMNASYSLLWGHEMARLQAPDYTVPAADTPHPLANAIGAAVSVAGTEGAEIAHAAINYATLGACVVLVFLLAHTWFGSAAGLLAAGLFISKPSIYANGMTSHLDTLYLALVLAAVLVELRRPRNGAATLALLAVAGLMRPEAWLFAGLYVLYVAWRDRPRFLRLTALAALAPVIWLAADAVVTGNPLHSFTYTREFAQELQRDTGLRDALTLLPTRLSDLTSKVVLVAGLVGALAATFLAPRGTRALVALLAATIAVYIALGTIGFSIVGRYLIVSAALISILAGYAMTAWLEPGRSGRPQLALAAVGLLLAAATATFVPEWVRAGSDARSAAQVQDRGRDHLRALVDAGTFDPACGPVMLPSRRQTSNVARWSGRPHSSVKTMTLERPARGYYVLPGNERLYGLIDQEMGGGNRFAAPAGFGFVTRNESWIVRGRCAA